MAEREYTRAERVSVVVAGYLHADVRSIDWNQWDDVSVIYANGYHERITPEQVVDRFLGHSF